MTKFEKSIESKRETERRMADPNVADNAELEAVHQKLLQAHTIMKEALEWLTTDACFLNCSHISKREFAVKTLKRVAEVMP